MQNSTYLLVQVYNKGKSILDMYIEALRRLDDKIEMDGYTKEKVMNIIEIMNDVGLWGDRAKKENDDLSEEVDQLKKKIANSRRRMTNSRTPLRTQSRNTLRGNTMRARKDLG